ncbi:MAG: GGDEF domain-containing protein, partial [Gammaproteobacteria bacterium]|nr:GGDEF domain-containing protein [Gammaproteobacteria bacterium]
MAELLSYIVLGAICGAAITAVVAYRLLRKAQNAALALESQLRAHSFELQIALDELAEKNNLLLQQSRIDSLSGVFNRSYFDQQMRAELKRS